MTDDRAHNLARKHWEQEFAYSVEYLLDGPPRWPHKYIGPCANGRGGVYVSTDHNAHAWRRILSKELHRGTMP